MLNRFRPRKFGLLYCVVAAALIAIGLPFAMGWTFGQRCAALYPDGSDAWKSCVTALAHGKSR